MRRIICNLDCELAFEGRGAKLPEAVLRRISEYARLLAVFAGPGDELWTPRPIDALEPRVTSGPLEALPPAAAILAWGETEEVARDRRRSPVRPSARATGLRGLLWSIPPPRPEVAARANDKRLALQLAREIGAALPGARTVASVEALEEAIAAMSGPWVLKAPFSAAGRSRVRGDGPGLDETTRRRARRHLAAHGESVVEPWLARLDDFGCAGVVLPAGATLIGIHRAEVGPDGTWRGIVAGEDPGLPREDAKTLERRFFELAARLHALGYTGPLGIDAFRYRDQYGEVRLHAPNEINARLTFGHVAWAMVERAGGRPVTLHPSSATASSAS